MAVGVVMAGGTGVPYDHADCGDAVVSLHGHHQVISEETLTKLRKLVSMYSGLLVIGRRSG